MRRAFTKKDGLDLFGLSQRAEPGEIGGQCRVSLESLFKGGIGYLENHGRSPRNSLMTTCHVCYNMDSSLDTGGTRQPQRSLRTQINDMLAYRTQNIRAGSRL